MKSLTLNSPSGSFEGPAIAAVAGCDGMIGVEAASGLKGREFPTGVFIADLFSGDMAGDDEETLRLFLTDELDDLEEEVEEEEFLLCRLFFELPVFLGLLLGRLSAAFSFLCRTRDWSESSLSSLSCRSEESQIGSDRDDPGYPVVVVVVGLSTGLTELGLELATAATSLGTKRSLAVSLVSIMATPRMVPASSTTLNE